MQYWKIRLRWLVSFMACMAMFSASGQECLMESRILYLDFGTDAAPRHDFVMGTTRYEQMNGGCPDDGFYSIASRSKRCFDGRWLDGWNDFTVGDDNGRMLIINASPDPRRLFQLPINSLKGGRLYVFSFAIANLLRSADNCTPTQPEIVVKVETLKGALIRRFSTGVIAQQTSFTWINPQFQFRLPEGESGIVIRIENNVPGGCGNDFALDDLKLVMCREQNVLDALTKTSEKSASKGNTKPRIILEQHSNNEEEKRTMEQREAAVQSELKAENDRKEALLKEVEAKQRQAELNEQKMTAEKAQQKTSEKGGMKDWNLRSNPVAGEIVVKEAGELSLSVFDADQVDGDTISLLVNRKIVFNRAGLTEKPLVTSIALNERGESVDVLLIAENLGRIPPNTARVVVTGPGGLRKELDVRTGAAENAVLRFKLN